VRLGRRSAGNGNERTAPGRINAHGVRALEELAVAKRAPSRTSPPAEHGRPWYTERSDTILVLGPAEPGGDYECAGFVSNQGRSDRDRPRVHLTRYRPRRRTGRPARLNISMLYGGTVPKEMRPARRFRSRSRYPARWTGRQIEFALRFHVPTGSQCGRITHVRGPREALRASTAGTGRPRSCRRAGWQLVRPFRTISTTRVGQGENRVAGHGR